VNRIVLAVAALPLFLFPIAAQQQSPNPAPQKDSAYAAIPVTAANATNPVKPTPESLARAKKWWALDCEMCHGTNGDGKGDTAKDMKLTLPDFGDPATFKDRSDGALYWIIKNGHNDMPAEGPRITTEQGWDLVNYVRSLAKKGAPESKPEPESKQ